MASIRTAAGSLPEYAMQLRFERQHSAVDLDGNVFFVRWLLIVFCLPSICQTSDVIIPPVIIEGLATDMISGQTVSLPCIANGTPPLTYEWYRNGQPFKPDSKSHVGSDGNLSLRDPIEGFYQCRVRNGAGLAVSSITHLQSPVFEERTGIRLERVVKDAFLPLVRPCNHILRSVPQAEISWQYDNSDDDSRIVQSERVIVTDNGSLVFTSLLPNDSNRDDSSHYKCVATNPATGRGVGGSYFNLKVNPVSSGGNHESAPLLIYSSDHTVHVLEGKPFSLWCIFSGVNTSGASWQLPNGTTLPPTWRLHFPAAKSSDEGNYSCSAVVVGNTKRTTEKTIRVIVDARPRLEEPVQSQKVQRGDSAEFTCRGTGRPPPTVSWLINGTPYNVTAHNGTWYDGFPHQGSYSLLLPDVQNSASIACNVSNIHGHQLSSSYLIVGDSVATSTASPSSPSRNALTSTLRASFPSSAGSNKESEEDGSNSSSTVFPDNGKTDPAKQNPPVGSALGEYGVPILVAPVVVVLIGLTVAIICVLMRKRRTRKYSLKVQDTEATGTLKSGVNRGQDGKTWACDSDDSGYDDVGRKPSASLKPKRHLTDPPVVTRISRL